MLTTGSIQGMTWSVNTVCVEVGPSPASTDLFYTQFRASDSEAVLGFKRNLASLLAHALVAGYPVSVTHDQATGEIQSVAAGAFDIFPVGRAVHNDFYSVTGSGIPADAEMVFDSATATVTIVPDMVRPHWAFVYELPTSIPLGRNLVRLQNAAGWASDWVPVDVSAGPPETVRTLYGGDPKEFPYTIVFVANPNLETEAGPLVADPVLLDRHSYHQTVRASLLSLLTRSEDLLRQNDRDRQIRLVSVFDTTLPVSVANTLVRENSGNIHPLADLFNDFLDRYGVAADVVFMVSGSDSRRATAAMSKGRPSNGLRATPFTYDGVQYWHEHFVDKPGGAALPNAMWQGSMTALHEFGHAASDTLYGRVNDLYGDGGPGNAPLTLNKKHRAASTDPIPAVFCNYNGVDFAADPNRDGIGYPPTWTSYHPELPDPSLPNIMDNTTSAPGSTGGQLCRFDRLTYAWLADRLRAKLNR